MKSRHRLLLWLWKNVPFPQWLRDLYIGLTHPRFHVGVVAYIEDSEQGVLLFHHTYRRHHPWSLPGGYLEKNESPQKGIEREVREESSLTIRAGRTLAVAFHSRSQLDLLIHCEIMHGTPVASPEVNGWRYVKRAQLAEILPNHQRLLRQAQLIQ
ncbi:MAG: NUDIX hydrolase [Chloroflexota bacterium]